MDGTKTISCDDGTTVTVNDGAAGAAGAAGANGTSCTVTDNMDGTKTISCDDGTSVVVTDGSNGSSCTVTDNGDGTKTIACDDGTSVVVRDGTNGRDGTVFDPTINYNAVHDANAPDYNTDCVSCHRGLDLPSSLDPTNFPGFHAQKLASPVIVGATLNDKCQVCHPTVDLFEGSAATFRRNVDTTICSTCHAAGTYMFYQAQ